MVMESFITVLVSDCTLKVGKSLPVLALRVDQRLADPCELLLLRDDLGGAQLACTIATLEQQQIAGDQRRDLGPIQRVRRCRSAKPSRRARQIGSDAGSQPVALDSSTSARAISA